METAISVINYNPTTKSDIAHFTHKLVGEVKSGLVNPLELRIKITAIQKCLDDVKAGISEYVMEEVKQEEQTFEKFGAKVEKAELGTKYIYDNCNDPVHKMLMKEKSELDQQIKDREMFLKCIKGSTDYINEDTGEITKIYPPQKQSTSGIKVTLK